MADDEEVVFENSALFKHLKDLGFNEEELGAEPKTQGFVPAGNETSNQKPTKKEAKEKPYRHKPQTLWQQVKTAFSQYLWNESWEEEVQQLHQKRADDLTDKILKHPILEDEDAAYIEGVAISVSDGKNNEAEDNVMGYILTQMSVLGVSLAYAFFRMMYMKSSDWSHRLYVWGLDILAILLTIVTLLPTTVKMASASQLVRKLKAYGDVSNDFLGCLLHLNKLSKKCVRLIQESELVSRGFTMVNPQTPVGRLEQGQLRATQRQCPVLRRVVFHNSRSVMLAFKEATLVLLQKFPSHVELEGVSSYLAHLSLDEYGPCVNLKDEFQLSEATDNFCIDALKAMVHLCNVHISEYMRVWCLGCLLSTEKAQQNIGFQDQSESIKGLHEKVNMLIGPLWRHYNLHKSLINRAEQAEEKARHKKFQQTPAQSVYIAVHSLNLHLQAALKRVQTMDDELDKVVNVEEDDKTEQTLTSELVAQMALDFEKTKADFDACKDCWEEGLARIEKISGKKRMPKNSDDQNTRENPDKDAPKTETASVIDIGEPIIEDQVFEAYTDPTETEDMENDSDWLISDEERDRRKLEKQEAVRMLKELRSVISVRAAEREERERQAILRQHPKTNPSDEESHDLTGANQAPQPSSHQSTAESHESQATNEKSQFSTNTGDDSQSQQGAFQHQRSTGNKCVPIAPNDIGTDCNNVTNNEQHNYSEGSGDKGESLTNSDLTELKAKLAGIGGENFPFTANVAAMAVARSQQMAALSVDTFGDDGEMSDLESDSDEDAKRP